MTLLLLLLAGKQQYHSDKRHGLLKKIFMKIYCFVLKLAHTNL
jgi:hypothetical protein